MAGYNFTSDVTTGFDFTDGDGGGGGGGTATVTGAQLESWLTDNATEPVGWTFAGSVGSIRGYADPVTGVPFRYVQLSCAAAADATITLSQLPITDLGDAQRVATEWLVRTGPAITGQGDMTYLGAIAFRHAAAWDHYVAIRLAPTVSANIAGVIVGSSTVAFDSGVPIAINTTYKFRVEIIGPGADPGPGGNPRAVFSVNDVVFGSQTFSTPATDVLRLQHFLGNGPDNPNDSYTVFLGPQAASWRVQ
jgi:hypothetical protein